MLGPIEYISGLEIEHGSEVLGWLEKYISLPVVMYLVSSRANVVAQGGNLNRSIIH
jgi:hypothetical protein